MRKFLFLVAVFFLLAMPPHALAANTPTKTTTLETGSTINKDYFAFNERVEIFGNVQGDVYAAGGTVLVEGTIDGDLLVAGGQVTFSGQTTGDIRVGGGQVTINGQVGKNLTVAGGSVEITSSAKINGSLVAAGGSINLNAAVGGNVRIGGGNVVISNTVGGEVESWVGSLRLTPNAQIAGNVNYWSTEEISLAKGAVVKGSVFKNTPAKAHIDKEEVEGKILGILTGVSLFFKVLSLFTILIVGILLSKFAPNFNQKVIDNLTTKPWQSFGIGFLSLVVFLITSVLLIITILGAPLGLITLTLFTLMVFLSRVFVVIFLGQFVLEKTGNKNNTFISLVFGVVIYGILTLLPIIGGLTTFLATVFSIGALLITKKEFYQQARAKQLL